MTKFASPASVWTPKDRTPAEWATHHRRVVALLIALGLLCSYPVGVFAVALWTAPRPTPAAAPAIAGSGVVLSTNDATGTVSIQHTGIPALGLAPGAAAFRAAPDLFKRIYVGDQLTFHLTRDQGAYAITGVDNVIPAQH